MGNFLNDEDTSVLEDNTVIKQNVAKDNSTTENTTKEPSSQNSKKGGFSKDILSEVALKALMGFADGIIQENKDLDNGDTTLWSSYSEAEELVADSTNVITHIKSLDSLQSEALKVISGAKDSGNSTLKEVKDLSSFVANITDSVKNINDIAERVHVLSLNAAIEAARAGERGKGFAVVSSEIRSLAGSTAQRVEEISEYIRQSTSAVDRLVDGTNLTANSVSTTLEKLSAAITCGKELSELSKGMGNQILKTKHAYNIVSMRRKHSGIRAVVLKCLAAGTSFADRDDVPSSRQCFLAHWYRENRHGNRGVSGDTTTYKRLDEAHEVFHNAINQIQRAMQYENKDQIFKLLEELENSNKTVSDCLLLIINAMITNPNHPQDWR